MFSSSAAWWPPAVRKTSLGLARMVWLDDISRSGIRLACVILLIIASAFESLRITVGGMRCIRICFPPFFLFLLVALPRIKRLPKSILLGIVLFIFLFLLSIFQEGWSSDIAKICAPLITVVMAALLLRSRGDFHLAAFALALVAVVISLKGLLGKGELSIDVQALGAIANRNALSIYTLPGLLLAGWLVIDKSTPKVSRLLLAVMAMTIIVTAFASGNRSGWIGVFLIAAMLASQGRSLRANILMGVIAFGLTTSSQIKWILG